MRSGGRLAATADPRVPFVLTLESLRVAELVNNDAWDNLIAPAEKFGLTRVEEMLLRQPAPPRLV